MTKPKPHKPKEKPKRKQEERIPVEVKAFDAMIDRLVRVKAPSRKK